MRKPEFITFTGIDDSTDLSRVASLSERYPLEWGVLFSGTQQGKAKRWPGLRALGDVQLYSRSVNFAAHLCGAYAHLVVARGGLALDSMQIPAVLTGVYKRVQINDTFPSRENIFSFQQRLGIRCIAQEVRGPFSHDDRISWLYDPSSGIGHRPAAWPIHPGDNRLVGYAGGIGPENVTEVLAQIDSTGPYWIDMETRVRSNEWLDLDKCEAVCRAVYGERA